MCGTAFQGPSSPGNASIVQPLLAAHDDVEPAAQIDPREFLPLRLPVFAGHGERGLAGGVCRDAGAGGAEGGGPPPGAAQCGGSFQPVSGRHGAA